MNTIINLWTLRKQIILNSNNISDYINDLNIEPVLCYKFFNGYFSYLCDCIYNDFPDISDDEMYAMIIKYDNPIKLEEWYYLYKMCYSKSIDESDGDV